MRAPPFRSRCMPLHCLPLRFCSAPAAAADTDAPTPATPPAAPREGKPRADSLEDYIDHLLTAPLPGQSGGAETLAKVESVETRLARLQMVWQLYAAPAP